MSFESIIQKIRRHSREEYRQLMVEGITDLRIWIQEHGEQATVLGLALGAVVVLAFKLVLWLIFLALAIGLTVFLIARPDIGSEGVSPTEDDGSTSTSSHREQGSASPADDSPRSGHTEH